MTPTTLRFQQQATSGATGPSDTNAHQIFPAQGTTETGAVTNIGKNRSLCNYLTDLQVYAVAGASLYTVSILDGITVIWTSSLNAPSLTPIAPYSFTTPLKGSPNTAMFIKFNSGTPSPVWNAQGFVAAANL